MLQYHLQQSSIYQSLTLIYHLKIDQKCNTLTNKINSKKLFLWFWVKKYS